jgi:predicted CoA-substrate-specific enzyme activase
MSRRSRIVGVDVGSVSVSVAEIDWDGRILNTHYRFHHGDLAETLNRIFSELAPIGDLLLAATTSSPLFINAKKRYDDRVCLIEAFRQYYDRVGTILQVGGERFGAVFFDEDGRYVRYKTNTSCAAGTGSFLDQQARRLNLDGVKELGRIAYENRGEAPKIATRCAVFAKTDLVHAQQEGYSLSEICDGLCRGLARNIVDTLFTTTRPLEPIVLTGGVSQNPAVVRHLREFLSVDVIVDKYFTHGAIGAALHLLKDETNRQEQPRRPPLVRSAKEDEANKYGHPSLEIRLSDYPDFGGHDQYEFSYSNTPGIRPVEVDVYAGLDKGRIYEVFLGVDIGSTSTKATLVGSDKSVLAGFYTRTAGRPVEACRQILASIDDLRKRYDIELIVKGAGTTGSGRKLVGRIIGADTIIDEITAHARAAIELDPGVDTIIEIGGQDSKFTVLRDGAVTFSVMNTVCAAGTGSFIEELADRLSCPLQDLSRRALGHTSPMVSDRCTVFMERDINHYLREGYKVDEVLASVLHAVRENYLTKVAIEGGIGRNVHFQGATAKNMALVAAFEQRLEQPIRVSPFCHLTGALGTGLMLMDEGVERTKFRGIGLYERAIPITSEICELCPNHCKITKADLGKETVAYGFLCGRDYETKRKATVNPSGFDLLAERKRILSPDPRPLKKDGPVIGLPTGLHMLEDLPLWRKFFQELGLKTVTGEKYNGALKRGKQLAGAEFCAPLTTLLGQVDHLADKADVVFLPVYLERWIGDHNVRRQYCYYTQYATALAQQIRDDLNADRILTPLVQYAYGGIHMRFQLYQALKKIPGFNSGFLEISEAYNRAVKFKESGMEQLKEVFRSQTEESSDVSVVLLGRPYTVLPESMNKGVLRIFQRLGLKVFFQDMVPYDEKDTELEGLLNEVHWHFGQQTLQAAEAVAKTPGVYPVFMTAFKCTPDAFNTDYFKRIMEAHQKPYLILQLDEHDLSVGYETRIEAAVRSFRNHFQRAREPETVEYPMMLRQAEKVSLSNKKVYLPNWDDLTLRFMASNLRRYGVNAHRLRPSEASQMKGLRHNTGQCTPLNIIAQEFIDNVIADGVDPGDAVLWMPYSRMACNLGLFPHHIRSIILNHGQGMERAQVYVGEISFIDISVKLPIGTYFAMMFGGLMRKAACKIRPYEKMPGATDMAVAKGAEILDQAFLGEAPRETAVAEAVALFKAVETEVERMPRPKAAIFGDLYARDNEVVNQDLVKLIEACGGEAITTPYTDYVKMISKAYFRRWFMEGNYFELLSGEALLVTMNRLEKRYYRMFEEVLREPQPVFDASPADILAEYGVRLEHTGESMDNLLKIFYLTREHPDLAVFVQTSPAFCCPSLVTEAMAARIEAVTGVPVVSITYDGTGGLKNDALIPYLTYPRYQRDRDGRQPARKI